MPNLKNQTYQLNSPETPLTSNHRIHSTKDLKNLFAHLEEDFHKPLVMHMLGYSHRTIAETLNIEIKEVESRLLYAYRHIENFTPEFSG
ncbi:MAG: hypothetical protein RR212_12740 [Bacteroidales bacterium]